MEHDQAVASHVTQVSHVLISECGALGPRPRLKAFWRCAAVGSLWFLEHSKRKAAFSIAQAAAGRFELQGKPQIILLSVWILTHILSRVPGLSKEAGLIKHCSFLIPHPPLTPHPFSFPPLHLLTHNPFYYGVSIVHLPCQAVMVQSHWWVTVWLIEWLMLQATWLTQQFHLTLYPTEISCFSYTHAIEKRKCLSAHYTTTFNILLDRSVMG